MNTTTKTSEAPARIEYPAKSGIYIREIPNISGGQEFGRSFMVTVPARITGSGRLRRQHPTIEAARSWAADQLHTGRKLGAGFYQLSAEEQKLCMEALTLLRPKGISILKAAQFAAERLSSEVSTVTAAEVAAELIENRRGANASGRYLEDLKARLGRFSDRFPQPLSHCTATEITDWLTSLKKAPQTMLNYKRVIGTMFEYAKERGYLPRNFNEHDFVKTPKVYNTGDIGIFSVSEVTKLLNASSPAFKPCMAISFFSGMRSSEIERLTWDKIKLTEKTIECRGRKGTRARRLIAIPKNLSSYLAPHVAAGASGLVWKGTHDAYYKEQENAVKLSGVAWKWNGGRRTTSSCRVAQGEDVNKVALESGHTTETLFGHYRELVSPKKAKAHFKISDKRPANLVALAKVS